MVWMPVGSLSKRLAAWVLTEGEGRAGVPGLMWDQGGFENTSVSASCPAGFRLQHSLSDSLTVQVCVVAVCVNKNVYAYF